MILNATKIVAVGLIILFSAPTADNNGTQFVKVHNATEQTDKSIEETMRESAESVFKIHMGFPSSGTAFFISKDGLAMTAGHVVDRDLEGKLTGAHTWINKKRYEIKIIDRSNITDLALIRVIGIEDTKPIELGIHPKFAEKLFSIGYPRGNSRNLTEGRMMNDSQIMRNGLLTITASIPTWPGDSGSPVFRSNGNVVGVRVAVSNLVNRHCLIVSSKMIVEYLNVLAKKEPSPFKK